MNYFQPRTFAQTRRGNVRPAGEVQPIQNAQKFALMTLPIPDENIIGPDGVVINPGNGITPRGGTITQWMDPDLATACFTEARRQMDIAVSIANGKDFSLDSDGQIALLSALSWIIQGYNALNVPWYMDPDARGLFRQFIAGPPASMAGFTSTAEFANFPSYNGEWLFPGGKYPGYSKGSISQQMLSLMISVPELNDLQHTKQCPTIWPYIQSVVANPSTSDPTYANDVANAVGFGGFQDETNFGWVSAPSGDQSRYWKSPAGPNIDANHPFQGVTNNSWRTFSWQNNTFFQQFGQEKLITVPLIFYVPWVDAWATSVTSRSPQQIVIAARTYTAYSNTQKANISGSAATFVQQVLAVPGLANQQETTGTTQDSLRVAATTIGALGVAFSGVTYGISGIVGGIIAGGLSIASAEVRNTPRIARDDLGRFKPIIDRGWLGGNPALSSDIGRPPITVRAPAGWVRPLAYSPVAPRYSISDFKPLNPAPPSLPPGYSIDANGNITMPTAIPQWAWIAGTVALVAAGYVGYLWIAGPAATQTAVRSNPSVRRRRKHKARQ